MFTPLAESRDGERAVLVTGIGVVAAIGLAISIGVLFLVGWAPAGDYLGAWHLRLSPRVAHHAMFGTGFVLYWNASSRPDSHWLGMGPRTIPGRHKFAAPDARVDKGRSSSKGWDRGIC